MTTSSRAVSFAGDRIRTLTFTGTVGTGKTTIARWAFARRLLPAVVQGQVVGRRGAWRRMASFSAALGSDVGSAQKTDAALTR